MTDIPLFRRNWSVAVDDREYNDLALEFVVERSLKPEPNTCELVIFNLSKAHRSELEELRPKEGELIGIPVKITAGYDAGDSLIYLGDVRTVDSERSGPDIMTVLQSGDGEEAYNAARVNQSFGLATPAVTILKALAKAMGVGVGNLEFAASRLALSESLGTIGSLSTQGIVISGAAAEHLSKWCDSVGLEWSLQEGKLQFAEQGQPVLGSVVVVTKETGMIGEPTVDNEGIATIDTLMIPGVTPGALMTVKSSKVVGNFRVERCTYSGQTHGNDWYITSECSRL